METKDLGRLFVVRGVLTDQAKSDLVRRQKTWELDPPYRYSNALVIRLRGTGLLVGWWRKSPANSLEEHFRLALNAEEIIDFGREYSEYPQNREPQHATKIREFDWDEMTEDQRKEAGSRRVFVSYDHDPL